MMLEVARTIVHSPRPRRSIMFIGFDLEEAGLFGSRYFIAHQPRPARANLALHHRRYDLASIRRCVPVECVRHGNRERPGPAPWIDQASRGRNLAVDLMGADLLVLNRSDYGPFRSKSIPFLFFTTGENPRYHTTEDTPETVDYPKLTEISQMIAAVVQKAVDAPEVPHWQSNPDNPFAEAVAIRDVLDTLAKNSEKLKIGRPQLYLINNTLASLEGIVKRGKITPEERARVIQACRIVLFTVL